jgi:hypothetical protein
VNPPRRVDPFNARRRIVWDFWTGVALGSMLNRRPLTRQEEQESFETWAIILIALAVLMFFPSVVGGNVVFAIYG